MNPLPVRIAIESAATAMGIEVANAERLMLTLRAVELLERTGETFSNAENIERLPLRGKRGYALPWTQGRPGPDRPDA